MWMYSKLYAAWSRGVVAKHAALSRPRSRVRIPSGPLSVNPPSSSKPNRLLICETDNVQNGFTLRVRNTHEVAQLLLGDFAL